MPQNRRIPLYLRKNVDDELNHLFEAEVIEPVQDSSELVSPVLIISKKYSSEIRLCLVMVEANKTIKQVCPVI